jgi:hypothetical protein
MAIQPATPDIIAECLVILEALGKDPSSTFPYITKRPNGAITQDAEAVKLRQACSFYLHKKGFSFPEIKDVLNYRSHSAAQMGSERFKRRIDGSNNEVTKIPETRFEQIRQRREPFQTEPYSDYSKTDRICLETLAEMNVTDPKTTLEQMRKREKGKLNRSYHIARIRMGCAFRLVVSQPQMTYKTIAEAVGYSDHSSVIHALNNQSKSQNSNHRK